MANSTRKRAQLQAERLAVARKTRRRRRWTTLFCLVVVLLAVGFIVWWLNRDDKASTGSAGTTAATTVGAAALTPPNASADGKGILANPAATNPTHALVIFGDYQCSACANLETALAPVFQAAAASTSVQLEFRNRDILDEDVSHGSWSRPASIASACADTVCAFLPYHLALYHHLGALSDMVLRQTIPQEIGLTGSALTQFQQCYDNQQTAAFVDSMEQAAAADMYNAGFTGTPTLVLDGQKLDLSTWTAADGRLDLDQAKAALGL
jgi:protein-disulfide isomerase